MSLLAGYSLAAGYQLTAATLLISVFCIGGTFMQLPISWMADRSSYRTGQLVCGLILLLGTLAFPLAD